MCVCVWLYVASVFLLLSYPALRTRHGGDGRRLRSQCSTNVGTFTYMSPERLENSPYSFASDIWSIGLSILELATGRYPYTNTAPVPFILEVPD